MNVDRPCRRALRLRPAWKPPQCKDSRELFGYTNVGPQLPGNARGRTMAAAAPTDASCGSRAGGTLSHNPMPDLCAEELWHGDAP